VLVGLSGIVIFSIVLGSSFAAGYQHFRPGTLLAAGVLMVTLIGAAVGAYVYSQTGDTIGFVLLWPPLPLVSLALFSAVGLSLLPVLILVFAMAGA